MFKKGQQVVCVSDKNWITFVSHTKRNGPTKDEIVSIAEVCLMFNDTAFELEEYPGWYYCAHAFRPIVGITSKEETEVVAEFYKIIRKQPKQV